MFSCTVIPTPTTIENRKVLEQRIKDKKLRLYKDIHVSGHGSREDIRDFLKLVKPKNIMTSHAPIKQMKAVKSLAKEIGYRDKQIFLVENGLELSF